MQTTYASILLGSIHAQDLLLTLGVSLLATLILFALAVEEGTYPRVRAHLHQLQDALRRAFERFRHRPGAA